MKGAVGFILCFLALWGEAFAGQPGTTGPLTAFAFVDSGQDLGSVDSSAVLAGDLDGDGDPDAVALAGNISTGTAGPSRVYLNNGAGTLVDSGQSFGPGCASSGVLADFDRDGDLDLVVANGDLVVGNPGQAAIQYSNDGTGHLTTVPWNQATLDILGVAAGDLNGDGAPDLVFTTRASGGRVFLNNGSGLFGAQTGPSLYTGLCRPVALADIDGDGDRDVLVGFAADGIRKFLNDGLGYFTDAGYFGMSGAQWLWATDLDGDGHDDLVAAGGDLRTAGTYAKQVYLNDGSGDFVEAGPPFGTNNALCGAGGDLDQDGLADFVAGHGDADPSAGIADQVYVRMAAASFSDSGLAIGNQDTFGLDVADIEGDGDLDLLTAAYNGGGNKLWLSDGASAIGANQPPVPPEVLSAAVYNQEIWLSWEPGTDTETPAGQLTYSLRIGTCSGANDVVSGATPVGAGNMGGKTAYRTLVLPAGTYYWSVRSVDGGLTRSAWAPEQTVQICGPTSVCGDITTDTTWTAACGPYRVTCNTTVKPNARLTVQPGVRIEFHGDYLLDVQGSIYCVGEALHPIRFTTANPAPPTSTWQGLKFTDSTDLHPCRLEHVIIEYADRGVDYQNKRASAPIELLDCAIHDFDTYGIYATGDNSSLNVTRCTIYQTLPALLGLKTGIALYSGNVRLTASALEIHDTVCGLDAYASDSPGMVVSVTGGSTFRSIAERAVYVHTAGSFEPSPQIAINNSNFQDNPAWNLYAIQYSDAETTVINARDNWWDSTDPVEIASKINDFSDLLWSPHVDWTPFMDGPMPGGSRVPGHFFQGVATTDLVLTAANGPYMLVGDLYIPDGRTLTAEAGAQVLVSYDTDGMGTGYKIHVYGRVLAQGAQGNKVRFTTTKTLDASGSDWDGIRFYDSPDTRPSALDWCVIANAARSVSFENKRGSAACTFTNCVFRDFGDCGLFVTGDQSQVRVTGSQIYQGLAGLLDRNTAIHLDRGNVNLTLDSTEIFDVADGIYAYSHSSPNMIVAANNCAFRSIANQAIYAAAYTNVYCGPHLSVGGCCLYDNGVWNLYLGCSNPSCIPFVNAENNWWGVEEDPQIAAKIHDHSDDTCAPVVDYGPWRYSPRAAFSASPTEGCAPLGVSFANESVGNPDTILWGFGDGQTSTESAPAHVYATPGVYTVTLTVWDDCIKNVSQRTGYIVVNAPPVAGFTANPLQGCAPHIVQFSNQSTGDITECLWDFGDGQTSTAFNPPPHTYDNPGIYLATLTVGNLCGSSAPASASIEVGQAPNAAFEAAPTGGCTPLTVHFTDASTGDGLQSWNWAFGDGETSTEQHPVHTYAATGTYTVSLTVGNSFCEDVESKPGLIQAEAGCDLESTRAFQFFKYASPGAELVTVRVANPGASDLTSFAIVETIPEGWTFDAVVAGNPDQAPSPGSTGTLTFAWAAVPTFPVTLTYRLAVPEGQAGEQAFAGEIRYARSGGCERICPVGPLEVINQRVYHSSDYNPANHKIALPELLRMIQFYNSTGYHVQSGTADGYGPGPGSHEGAPHDSDYKPQDWKAGLPELLRLIQFYNSGGYQVQEGTADGFAPLP